MRVHDQPCDACMRELQNEYGIVSFQTSCGWVGDSRDLGREIEVLRSALRTMLDFADPLRVSEHWVTQRQVLPEHRPDVPEKAPESSDEA